ncbi:MAG TPA: TOBE domain-containing protein, partial [Methylomirabilota bacterium]|nr:TOBE domain-containing protein [Methylomirabilota bacterium]
IAASAIADGHAGELRSVALRPETVALHELAGDGNRMAGTVEDVNFLGSIVRIRVRFEENAISLDAFNNPNLSLPERGHRVAVSFPREAVLALDAPPTASPAE